MTKSISTISSYRSGNAYFICDRCSQRWRRSKMLTEWDNLKVCPVCIDPRPPQMMPPAIYPEGIPFMDARAPQDNPDRMQDDTSLMPITGGIGITNGQLIPGAPVGAISPRQVLESPIPPLSANLLEDDITIRTGPVAPPSVPNI